jgi:hypothetical protein
MKIKELFIVMLCFVCLQGTLALESERRLKRYDSTTGDDLDEAELTTPFSTQLAFKATVTKPKPGGGYYMIAFASDVLRSKIYHVDLAQGMETWSGQFGDSTGSCQFTAPLGIAADQHGNVFVVDADSAAGRIVKLYYDFDADTLSFVQSITSGFNEPYDVAIDTNRTSTPTDDRIWVTDTGNHRLVELDFYGNVLRTIGMQGSGVNQFDSPTAIKVFDHDENGVTWLSVGDSGNGRLVNMGTDGTWYTVPMYNDCLLYTSPSPRDRQKSRMPSSA